MNEWQTVPTNWRVRAAVCTILAFTGIHWHSLRQLDAPTAVRLHKLFIAPSHN